MRIRLMRVAVVGGLVLGLLGTGAVGAGASTGQGAKKPSGDPIVVGIIYSNDPAVSTGDTSLNSLQSAVKAQNARGGLNGRPVKVKSCVHDVTDANGAVACANEMVEDPDVVAILGSGGSQANAINPVLETVGMASIGSLPLQQSDFTSKITFPLGPGALTAAGPAALLADEFDIKNPALGVLDIASTASVPILMNQVLAPRGGEVAETVKLPVDKQDFSAEAAQLADASDGMIFAMAAEQFGRLMRSGQSSGVFDGKKIASFNAVVTPEQIKTLGSAVNGIYIAAGSATTDTKSPGMTRYLKELKKYSADARANAESDTTKLPWLSLQVFVAAAEGLPTVDRASVLDSMNKLVYDPQGLVPELDFTKENTTVFGGATPRIFNPSVMFAQVKKGKIKALDGTFVNPWEAS
jgi:ABC-type branched-subunit amino acid transport system substrate-binding protein